MSKLNLTQRRYIISQVIQELCDTLNAKYKNTTPKTFLSHTGYNHNHYWRGVKFVEQDKYGSKHKHLYLTFGSNFSKDTCIAMSKTAKDFAKSSKLPDSWYYDEYQAERYDIFIEMEPCMGRPKLEVKFSREKAALGRLRKSAIKNFEKDYKEMADVISEARYDCMEAVKWIKTEVIPKTMLSDDGVKLLEDLKKSTPNFK